VTVKLTCDAGLVSIAKAILGAPAAYPTWLTRTWGTACPAGTGVAGGAGVAGGRRAAGARQRQQAGRHGDRGGREGPSVSGMAHGGVLSA
jgi:hypothetical protein